MSASLVEQLAELDDQANTLLDQVTELELAHQQVSDQLLTVLKTERQLALKLWNEAS